MLLGGMRDQGKQLQSEAGNKAPDVLRQCSRATGIVMFTFAAEGAAGMPLTQPR